MFNKIIAEEAMNRGLRVVDVFPLSKEMHDDTSLGRRGLRASFREEYAEWEKLIFPTAFELLISKSTAVFALAFQVEQRIIRARRVF